MRHRWPPYLATGLLAIAAAILIMAYTAFATDVNVTQTARCVNADTGRYDVTVTAHNSYDQTLHVTVNNPASPIVLTLAAGQTWAYTFHVTVDSWTVKVTSPDAVLHGDTNHTWTLEDVCGLPATTTTSPPTTSCAQANPPRNDCQPSETVPTVASTTVTPPPTSAVAPPDQPPSSPDGPVSSPPATATPPLPSTVGLPPSLPITGSQDTWRLGIAGFVAVLTGAIILTGARRRG